MSAMNRQLMAAFKKRYCSKCAHVACKTDEMRLYTLDDGTIACRRYKCKVDDWKWME